MAYKITDDCMMCGLCAENCPNKAISEGDTKYVIDPERCTECARCEINCPQKACIIDPDCSKIN